MKTCDTNTLTSVIGKGLIAGLAATAAITLSQMIEMKFTHREPSEAPLKAAGKVIGVKPKSKYEKKKVSQEIHWAYGASLGMLRGIINLTGLKGLPATAAHFATVWGGSMIMLPALKAAPPVIEENRKTIAIDGFHHAVYALTAGLVYDALDTGGKYPDIINYCLYKKWPARIPGAAIFLLRLFIFKLKQGLLQTDRLLFFLYRR